MRTGILLKPYHPLKLPGRCRLCTPDSGQLAPSQHALNHSLKNMGLALGIVLVGGFESNTVIVT